MLNAAVAILPRGKCIPFQSNIPGRAFRNPPHPETATHYSAKNRVAFSRPLDATPIHQPHPKSVPNCRQKRNVPKCRPNDYHGNAAGRGRTASGHQSEQIGMKRGRHRPSGHAVLFEWQVVALVPAQRRAVAAFGKTPQRTSSSSHSSSRWLRNRRQTTRYPRWRNT